MRRKIEQIKEAIGNLENVLITDEHMEAFDNILVEAFSDDTDGAVLEQAIVEEVEYMLRDGLLDDLAKELVIDSEDIEKEFRNNAETLIDSISEKINFHSEIVDVLKNHFDNKL